MSSLFNIGLSSLFASKCALMVSNQNIANAQNPFYSRRTIDFKEASDSGFGNGVQLFDVRRVVDNIINKNLVQSNSHYASADTYAQALKAFEPQLDNGANSVATYIQQSLNQLNNLNASASSIQGRNAYLNQLKSVADRFNQISHQIDTEKQNIRQTVVADVEELNTITQQLAQLNTQIAGSTASAAAPENLALLDERDRLLNHMAEYINFDSYTDDRGMTNVKLSNGISLVFGGNAATFTTFPAANSPTSLDIAITNTGSHEVITPFITSGKIAGIQSFQHTGLEAAERGLDRLALVISAALNAQNKLGMDLNGDLGGNIFNDMNVGSLAANRSLSSPANTGSGAFSVDISDVSKLNDSGYHVTFDSPSHYQLVRDSDNHVVGTSDAPNGLNVDGFVLNITNSNFHTGDSFFVSPTRGAAAALNVAITDPRQLALAFPVAANPLATNLGSGAIHVTSITDTTTPTFAMQGQLSPPISIQFVSSTQYSLVNTQTGSQIGGVIQYDLNVGSSIFPTADGYDPGYRVSLSGEMNAGDQFQINYNPSSIDDNRNGLLMADMYQQGVMDGGSLNFVQGYHAVSNDLSSKTNVAKMMEETQGIIKSQAELRRDQVSGVSLEEEVGNVARYQQSYQASARILETVSTMFDVLLNLGRR